jgi:hypothetical protein
VIVITSCVFSGPTAVEQTNDVPTPARCSDENSIYIGDVGNNIGNRIDLKIYKIAIDDYHNNDTVVAEIINFEYADQIENSSAAQAFIKTGRTIEYYGPGSLYGLPWQCKVDGSFIVDDQEGGCDTATDFKPLDGLPDGTVLIDNTTDKWVTKGVTKESKMATTAASVCNNAVDADNNNLGLSDLTLLLGRYPELTTSFITPVKNTWDVSIDDATLNNATLRVEQGDDGENGQLIE